MSSNLLNNFIIALQIRDKWTFDFKVYFINLVNLLRNRKNIIFRRATHQKIRNNFLNYLVIFFILLCSFSSIKAENSEIFDSSSKIEISKNEFNQAADRTFEKSIYNWQSKRTINKNVPKHKIFDQITKSIKDIVNFLYKIIVKIIKFFEKKNSNGDLQDKSGLNLSQGLKFFLLALIIIAIVLIVQIMIKYRKKEKDNQVEDLIEVDAVPDLKQEDIDIKLFSDSGWMKLARKYEEKGDLLLALRAIFLGILAFLASQNWITLRKFKSIRNYKEELIRRLYKKPEIIDIYNKNTCIYEKIWYGNEAVELEIIENLKTDFNMIKSYAKK